MLREKDISMLRKRMDINSNNITLWRAVLVGNDGEIEDSYGGKHLMNLEEGIIFKHLKILKEIMNRKVNDKLIDIEIKEEHRAADLYAGMRDILEDPREQDQLIDLVLATITDAYRVPDKYMLLMYLDTYDVPNTAADGQELEDGDVVYKSLNFAICPVSLDHEGLSILPTNTGTSIQEKIRQWIVGSPRLGFVYPAFREAEPDYKSLMYYTAKSDEPRHYFMENVLSCNPKQTATEKRQMFERCVRILEDEKSEIYLERLNEILFCLNETNAILTPIKLYEYLSQCGASGDETEEIRDVFENEFRRYGYPEIRFITNDKILKNLDARRRKENVKKVMTMSAAKLAEYGEHSIVEELKAEVKRIV